MNKRVKNGAVALAAALLVFLLLIISGIVPLNLAPLAKPITGLLQDSTGLRLSAPGRLQLRLGLNPQLQASSLEVLSGNGASYFARIADLSVGLQLSKILDRELSFNNVLVSGLKVDICVPPPTLATTYGEDTSEPLLLSLHRVEGVEIEIGCSSDTDNSPLRIASLQGRAVAGRDLMVAADIQWRGAAFDIDLAGGPLEELLYSSTPYLAQLNAKTGFATLELDATIEELFGDVTLGGLVKARLEQPDGLLGMFDIQPLGLPLFALDGQVAYSGTALSLDEMSGQLDTALWSLSGSLDWGEARPLLVLDTQLDQLDLDALLLPGHSVSTPGSQSAWDVDRELPLSLLDLVDARIDLRLTDLSGLQVPASNVALRLELEAGQAQLDLLQFQSSLGSGSGRVALDRSVSCPAWTVAASLSRVDLAAVGERAGLAPIVGALQTGQAALRACGSSLSGIRETLEAEATLAGLQIQPGSDLPTIRVTDASLAGGWRHGTLLKAHLLLEDHSVNARVEAGELSLHATVDSDKIDVSEFKLALGKSDLAGSLVFQLADGRRDSELVLRSKLMDIEGLQQLMPTSQEMPSTDSESLAIDWPNIKFDLAFAKIRLPERSITDVTLSGALREERIEDASLGLEVAAFSLAGRLDADLSEAQPGLEISATLQDIDVDRILQALEVDAHTNARARQLQLLLSTSGHDAAQLTDNLELDFQLEDLEWVFADQQSGPDVHLVLQEVVGVIHADKPISMHLAGQLDGFPVNGWLQLAPIGQVFDPLARLPVRAVLGTDRETVLLDGVFNRARGSGLEGKLQLSAIEKVVATAEYAALQAPLPGLVIDAEFDLGRDDRQIIELAATLASSHIEGRIVAIPRGERGQLQIELRAPHLQTADFTKLVAAFGDDGSEVDTPVEDETTQSSFLKLLDDYLQWLPERYDFDIQASIGALMANEDFLGGGDLHAIIDQQEIKLGKLKLSLPEGDVDLSYTMDHVGTELHSRLDAHVERFEVGGLLQTLDPESKASGTLYVDTSLDAVAPTTQELRGAMQGHFDLALFPQNLSANVLDLWATNLVLALVPRVEGDTEDINCLVAKFEVEEGVMQSRQIMLDSTNVIVRGKGTIDLSQRELDLIIAPQAKRERFLSVSSPMKITGTFDDFDIKMAGGGLLGIGFRWYLSLVYVPWKWLTGERFPADGTPACKKALGWEAG